MYFGEILDKEYKDRPGAYGILSRNNKVGVVKVRDKYFLPGGGIDPGEDVEEALKREILEETGYDSEVKNKVNEYTEFVESTKDKVFYRILGHVYHAELKDFIKDKIEDDHELVWVTPQEAMNKMAIKFQRYAIHEVYGIEYDDEER